MSLKIRTDSKCSKEAKEIDLRSYEKSSTDCNTVVIFDLEMTAWEGSVLRQWNGYDEDPEIIQIGAVEIALENGNFEITREFEQVIKPRLRPILSKYITELTGITQDIVEKRGISFSEAVKTFYEFVPRDSYLCSNGNDWQYLEFNCDLHAIKNPFRKCLFMNLRPFLATRLQVDEANEVLHSYRLGTISEMPGNSPHNALSDARCIAESLKRLGWSAF